MIETINGLHKCKPGNEPKIGDTKTFVVEQRPAKGDKKAWIKIKSAGAKFGGTPYKVVAVEPTGWEPDSWGNVSFNLELELLSGSGGGERSNGEATISHAGRHDPSPDHSLLDGRQRAIIRQHSQSMAMEVLKLKVTLNELTVEDLTPGKLRQLSDYFDKDVLEATQ